MLAADSREERTLGFGDLGICCSIDSGFPYFLHPRKESSLDQSALKKDLALIKKRFL